MSEERADVFHGDAGSQAYILYYFPTCPYCRKVLNYMRQNGIDIPLKNTWDPGVEEELVRIGGKAQVPCLVIDGKAMYESDDIIRYMKENIPVSL